MNRRAALLGAALFGAVGWSAWALVSSPAADVVEPARRGGVALAPATTHPDAGTGSTGEAAVPAPDALRLIPRPTAPSHARNLFDAYSYRAAPAAAAVAAAPVPHAPPLPFVYTGRLVIEGRATYLMLQGEAPVGITVGGAIGEFTLVDAAPDRLVFLHGPTGERVTMPIAAVAAN